VPRLSIAEILNRRLERVRGEQGTVFRLLWQASQEGKDFSLIDIYRFGEWLAQRKFGGAAARCPRRATAGGGKSHFYNALRAYSNPDFHRITARSGDPGMAIKAGKRTLMAWSFETLHGLRRDLVADGNIGFFHLLAPRFAWE
jgi:hypothetical protein